MKTPLRTGFLKGAVKPDEASSIFVLLRDSIEWEDGVPSRKHGFTRKAKALSVGDYPLLDSLIVNTLRKLTNTNYAIMGVYLNYYENGNMFTPNHSHPGSHQMVISLGETRVLTVGKKEYPMSNGDAIIFGSSIHGVPKSTSDKGRISIATFMIPI